MCLGFEGDLVTIKNEREMAFLKYRTSAYSEHLWIGLNDRVKEGHFAWSDGTLLDSSLDNYWRGGKPDNTENKDCVAFMDDGWNALSCDDTKHYICERPKRRLIFSLFLFVFSLISSNYVYNM